MCPNKSESKIQAIQSDASQATVATPLGTLTEKVQEVTTNAASAIAPNSELFLGAITGNGGSWLFPMVTNGSLVTFKLDTGAQANLLPRSLYDQLLEKPPLKPTTIRLMLYGADKPLSVDGQCICEVSVSLEGRSISRHLRFFVTSVPLADSLLRLAACEDLSFNKSSLRSQRDTLY